MQSQKMGLGTTVGSVSVEHTIEITKCRGQIEPHGTRGAALVGGEFHQAF